VTAGAAAPVPNRPKLVPVLAIINLLGATLLMLLVGLVWLVGQLVYFTRPRVVAAFHAQTQPQASQARPRSQSEPRPWRMVMLCTLLFLFTPVFVVNWVGNPFRGGTGETSTGETSTGTRMATAPTPSWIPAHDGGVRSTVELPPEWGMGPDGPTFTDVFARWSLKLQPEQIGSANAALQEVHREYLSLEEQYTERHTDANGHVITTIKPFPDPLAKLEDRLWSKLDAILDAEAQNIARLNLRLHGGPPVVPPATMDKLVAPGFFGWGNGGARVEIWRVGTWFHWRVTAHQHTDTSQAPQLPEPYRRFWKEPTTDDARTQGTLGQP
jgi:hypothetical protein